MIRCLGPMWGAALVGLNCCQTMAAEASFDLEKKVIVFKDVTFSFSRIPSGQIIAGSVRVSNATLVNSSLIILVSVLFFAALAAWRLRSRLMSRRFFLTDVFLLVLGVSAISVAINLWVIAASRRAERADVTEGEQSRSIRVKSFLLATTEVTQKQYGIIMGRYTSKRIDENLPIALVSTTDAERYCSELSIALGKKIRLPTGEEWEYACRAFSKYEFHFGPDGELLDQFDWWAGNSGGVMHKVGLKRANPFDLFDMHGNLQEICTSPNGYIIKGGAFASSRWDCRATGSQSFSAASDFIGFRIVLEE